MKRLQTPLLLALGVILLFMPQLYEWYENKTYPGEEIEAAFEPISSRYGIRIVYEIGNDFFSPLKNPPVPAGPPGNSKVKPIRHRVLIRYPDILQKAFDMYSVVVIKNYLKAIYFAGEINHDGLRYGGTFDPFRQIIFIVDNDTDNDDIAIHTFHHEFSSLLIAHHSFRINSWTDLNPQDFKYLGEKYDTWKEVNEVRKTITDAYCYKNGIVTNYGLADFSNDFSEYSAMILTHPKKFKKIMDRYPRVRSKFLVWLKFYQKVDPIFTEEYLFGKSG